MAVIEDWDVHSLDVVAAFLNGKVEEEIYMQQIPGYEDGTSDVLRVLGSLYGLIQVPRIWNKLFSDKVVTLGYTWMPLEPSIYTHRRGSDVAVLAVHVDN